MLMLVFTAKELFLSFIARFSTYLKHVNITDFLQFLVHNLIFIYEFIFCHVCNFWHQLLTFQQIPRHHLILDVYLNLILSYRSWLNFSPQIFQGNMTNFKTFLNCVKSIMVSQSLFFQELVCEARKFQGL